MRKGWRVPATTEEAATGTEVYVGRQPIYDRRRRVIGYELLFRPHASATASSLSNEEATAVVIVNTFTEFGLDELVGGRLAFINVPRGFVDGSYDLPFGPEGVVLELLESIPDTPETRAGVQRLHDAGYTLALDDYVRGSEQSAFLDLASYVKLDAQTTSTDEFAEVVAVCTERGLTVVAERVETQQQVELATRLDVGLFQGWYFAKAETLRSDAVQVSGVTALRLQALLADPDVTLAEVEHTVRVDLPLTYRILRVVNSAASGLSRTISSVREGIALLGLEKLRTWVMLFMLSDLCGGSESMLTRAVTRARACELLADDAGCVPHEAFTVGLLSHLDDLLGRPFSEVLDDLPLQPHLAAALLYGDGPLGLLLSAVRDYERRAMGEDLAPEADAGPAEDSVEAIARSYLASMGWSLRVCRDLLEPVETPAGA
jgi:c-di-GMP-related signal transduction protein